MGTWCFSNFMNDAIKTALSKLSLEEKMQIAHEVLCQIIETPSFLLKNRIADMSRIASELLAESMRLKARKG